MSPTPTEHELRQALSGRDPALLRQAAQDVGRLQCHPLAERLAGLLAYPQSGVQQAAVDAMLTLGHCPNPATLGELMAHHDPTVRSSTIELIERLGERANEATAHLARHEDVDVRVAIAQLLGRIQHSQCGELLVALMGDPEINVRVMAAESIAAVQDYSTLPALLEHLTDDPWVVCSVVNALGRLGVSGVAPAIDGVLQTALAHCDVPAVQACIDAICRLGEPQYLRILLGRMLLADAEQMKLFRQALGFSAAFLQVWPVLRAIESELIETACTSEAVGASDFAGLGRLGDFLSAGAADKLLHFAAMLNEDDMRREAVLAALGRSCPTHALIAAATEADEALALVALQALAQREWTNVGQAFARIARGGDRQRKLAVLSAIRHMGDAGTFSVVQELLDDDDGHVRRAAAETAGALDITSLARRLQEMLLNDYPDVATAAASALMAIEGGSELVLTTAALLPSDRKCCVLDALRECDTAAARATAQQCLRDPSHEVRGKAAEILLADSADPELAQHMLAGEDPFLRRAATRALPASLAREVVDTVIAQLRSVQDPWERYELVRLCQRCDLRSTEPILLNLLDDAHMAVQIAAIEALGDLGSMEAIPRLAALAESENLELARAATGALESVTTGGLV